MWTTLPRRPQSHSPTGEQNQKKRTYDVLPKPDNFIRYRQLVELDSRVPADLRKDRLYAWKLHVHGNLFPGLGGIQRPRRLSQWRHFSNFVVDDIGSRSCNREY